VKARFGRTFRRSAKRRGKLDPRTGTRKLRGPTTNQGYRGSVEKKMLGKDASEKKWELLDKESEGPRGQKFPERKMKKHWGEGESRPRESKTPAITCASDDQETGRGQKKYQKSSPGKESQTTVTTKGT